MSPRFDLIGGLRALAEEAQAKCLIARRIEAVARILDQEADRGRTTPEMLRVLAVSLKRVALDLLTEPSEPAS